VPLVLRVGMGSGKTRLYLGAGPAIGFKLGCSVSATTSSYSGGTDCTDAMGAKSTEVSGIVEAGLEFGKLSIGARGDLGITNAFEAVQSGSTSNVNVKTRTVSAVAAIRF
jgi:hypothetical protein